MATHYSATVTQVNLSTLAVGMPAYGPNSPSEDWRLRQTQLCICRRHVRQSFTDTWRRCRSGAKENDGKPNGQHVYHMAEVALAHVRHFVVNSNAPWTVRNRLTAAGAASLRMTRHCSCGNASFEIGPELVEIRSNLGPNL